MKRSNLIATTVGATALMFAGSPVFAQGKADRARAAIAEAHGKIDAANKVGVAGDAPRLQAEAQAALRTAEEELARGKKDEAIADALHASELADTALGAAQQARNAQASAQQPTLRPLPRRPSSRRRQPTNVPTQRSSRPPHQPPMPPPRVPRRR